MKNSLDLFTIFRGSFEISLINALSLALGVKNPKFSMLLLVNFLGSFLFILRLQRFLSFFKIFLILSLSFQFSPISLSDSLTRALICDYLLSSIGCWNKSLSLALIDEEEGSRDLDTEFDLDLDNDQCSLFLMFLAFMELEFLNFSELLLTRPLITLLFRRGKCIQLLFESELTLQRWLEIDISA